jgi:tetratricopeptide (TPR) repeat protein
MPMAHKAGVHSAALVALRRGRGLRTEDLATMAGRHPSQITRLETREEPSWEILVELAVAAMKYEIEEVESTVHGLRRAMESLRVPESPIPITEEEARAIRRVAGPVGRAFTDAREELLIRELRAEKAREARKEAEEVCAILLQAKVKMRLLYISTGTKFQTWAVAERLCEESTKAARSSARLVLEIASLACRVAARVRGDRRWRARVRGFCLAFLANAWRVQGEIKKAERIFFRALKLWGHGEAGDPDRIFPEWRILDLEASLRRDLRSFEEAIDLHKRAEAAVPRDILGRIILNKASTLDQMFEADQALAVLREAAPLIEEAKDPWLREGLGFLICVNLCHLSGYREAEWWLRVARPADPKNERELILTLP